MKLKEYENMGSVELEKYLLELLNSGLIKNERQRAEIEAVYKELRKQNFCNWFKKELKN